MSIALPERKLILLMGSAAPPWVLAPGGVLPSHFIDFSGNRAWVNGVGVVTAASLLTCVRASNAWAVDGNGNLIGPFASNVPRLVSGLGLVVEEARTNSIRCSDMTGAVVGDLQPELTTNGNFALNPVSPLPDTLLNNWEWHLNGGTGTVLWNGVNSVALTGDGTNTAAIGTIPLITVPGTVYTVSVDVSGFPTTGRAGTARFASNLSGAISLSAGTGKSLQFTATTTTSFLSFGISGALTTNITNVSVKSAGQALNGNFALNPINASQTTVQNGWQWQIAGGASTVTWNGSNGVILTPDGTNFADFGSGALTTVVGVTYTITFDLVSLGATVRAGTTALGANLLSTSVSAGTGQKLQFVATTTTSFISFVKTTSGAVTIQNVSVLSAGQLPNNWVLGGFPTGVVTSVQSLQTINGVKTITVVVNGTPGSTSTGTIRYESSTQIAAGYGSTWTGSHFLLGTSLTNLVLSSEVAEFTSGGVFVINSVQSAAVTSSLARYILSRTLTSTTTAFVNLRLDFGFTSGQPVSNALVTIGLPQIEINSHASVASATLGGGGSGGANGAVVLTVTGGAVSATINGTISGGVLTAVGSVTNPGSYVGGLPASPAAVTGGGLVGATVNLVPTNNAGIAFATTPIPTTSVAVTRAADAIALTTPPVFGSGYSFVMMGTPLAPILGTVNEPNQELMQVDDGTNNNRFILARQNTNGFAIFSSVATGGSGTGSTSLWSQNTFGKLAVSTTAGAQILVFNGGSPATAALALPVSVVNVRIGSNTVGASQWNGVLTVLEIFPTTALSAAALKQVST